MQDELESGGWGTGPSEEDAIEPDLAPPESTTTTTTTTVAPTTTGGPPTTTAAPPATTKPLESGAAKATITEGQRTKTAQLLRDPADAFEAFINMLLDQKLFFVRGLSSGALSRYSGEPMLDLFGVVSSQPIPKYASQVGYQDEGLGAGTETARMVEIASNEATPILMDAWLAETNTEPESRESDTGIAVLTTEQAEDFDLWRSITFAGQSHMYVLENSATDEDGRLLEEGVAIVPTYDGSVMGNMSTIEEALRAVPLDKPSLDTFVLNMSMTDARKYRALQSVMSMMGYYGNNIPQIRWGSYSHVDKNAFGWMMGEILTEELTVARYNRLNPDAKMPDPTVRGFIDGKYSDHLRESVRQANASSDGLEAFGADARAHIQNNLQESLTYLGAGSITNAMSDRIGSLVNEMFIEEDLDSAAILNTDLVGMQASDDDLRTADAWLAAFHGNQEGWADNIQFGVNGTPTELLRIAKGAGVDLTGLDLRHTQDPVAGKALGPHLGDDEVRARGEGPFEQITTPTTDQRLNIARWYFLTLLEQNNGNLTVAANQYANTIGNRVYETNQFDGTWLDNTVRIANQDPTSFAYKQGVETYEEQTQERIDALNSVQARAMAATEFSNISSKVGQKALGAVLSTLAAPKASRQRRRRT